MHSKYTGPVNVSTTSTLKFLAVDAAGNKSAVGSESYVIDGEAPVVSAPREHLPSPAQLGITAVPVGVGWAAATDAGGSGLDRYELQKSADGGVIWAGVALPTPLATDSTEPLEPGTAKYRYRLRAFDKAGNASPWSAGPAFSVNTLQEKDARVSYAGTWTSAAFSSAYGGALSYAGASGAKAVLSFTGGEVSWVSTKGPNRGKAEVWLDGTKVATVDLYAASGKPR